MAGKRSSISLSSSLSLSLSRPSSLSLLAPAPVIDARQRPSGKERAAGVAERGGLLISHGCTSSVIEVASRRGA